MTKTFYQVSGNPLKVTSREGEVKDKTVWFGAGWKGTNGRTYGRERVDIGSRGLHETPLAAAEDYLRMANREVEQAQITLGRWTERKAQAEAIVADCRASEVTAELSALIGRPTLPAGGPVSAPVA